MLFFQGLEELPILYRVDNAAMALLLFEKNPW